MGTSATDAGESAVNGTVGRAAVEQHTVSRRRRGLQGCMWEDSTVFGKMTITQPSAEKVEW